MAKTFEFNQPKALRLREDAFDREQTREEKRNERQGRRIAQYAIRMANKGHLDYPIPAKQFRWQPWSGLWFELDFDEGAYATAADILAESGLHLTPRRADVINRDPLNQYEYLIEISLLKQEEPRGGRIGNLVQRVRNIASDLLELE